MGPSACAACLPPTRTGRRGTREGPRRPGGTFLPKGADQPSSWATARRASASSTPQLISCSVSTEGDWS
ncbi:hypothetical protein DNK56_13750 [Streptomyces sp. AC1-42W]|nr:hypothetical protein DNK55_17690 [Streptomyces sp. AC1-42T]PZT83000.1 hypothetical protein DNK56_13750 [Streptomyces sp. AC1-42W]